MDYVQCNLRHTDGRYEISWIPEKFAIRGNSIKIKNNEVWEEGWKVMETYGKRDESSVLAMSEMHRHHREATDI
jgi:hypothetical protein